MTDQALLAKFQAMGLGAEAARLLGIAPDQAASSAPAHQSQVH